MRKIVLATYCIAAILALAACAQTADSADSTSPALTPSLPTPQSAQAQPTAAPDAPVTVQEPLTELAWPEGDYAAMNETEKDAYRAAVEGQLKADEYVILPDGYVAQSPAGGRYTPQELANAYPQAAALQTVGDYTLAEVQLGYHEAADAPTGMVQRYDSRPENIRGATLVYKGAGGRDTVTVCYIGCGAPTERTAPKAQDFGSEVLRYTAQQGEWTCYSVQAQCPAGGLVQINAVAEDSAAFQKAAEPFLAECGRLLLFAEG